MSRLVFVKLALAVALVCGLAGSASAQLSGILSGQTPLPKAVDPDRAAFMTPDIAKQLPRLGGEFSILGPSGKTHNAFAHVIGVTDRWINVETGTTDPLSEMDKHLSQDGYRRVEGLDTSLQAGVKKVVVYATVKVDGDIDQIKSAAVQLTDGTWSAKIGTMATIGFARAEQLNGSAYGKVVAVYEKAAPVRPSPFAIR